MIGRLLAAVLALAPLTPAAAAAGERIKVVASFTILADMVRQIGGDAVAVTALVGPDGDAHVYEPTPADARAIAQADLVVVNGLGFEGWMDRLVKAAAYKGPVVVATAGIEPLPAPAGHHHHHGHSHAHGGAGAADPHAWQSVANAKVYAETIARALAGAAPARAAAVQAGAAAYIAQLAALDAEIRAAFAPIPAAQRVAVTSHDAFGYYGRAYGVTFLAPVGLSTASEPSARRIAALIRQMKREGVKAMFMETIADPRLLEQIARETGARIGGRVYSDALSGPDGPAPTYVAMMRHNTRQFAAALRPGA